MLLDAYKVIMSACVNYINVDFRIGLVIVKGTADTWSVNA